MSMGIVREGERVLGVPALPGDGEVPWWHPQWIPWAHDNGDAQIVDMREGPHQGRIGRQWHDGSGDFSRSPPSLSYLGAVADVLERGGTIDSLAPFVHEPFDDGERELYWQPLDSSKRSPYAPAGMPAPAAPPPR
ncbi:hypothetical protein [Streptomyces sp. SHP 1-2]|uniref:hypothetical protein n=1 Tax=Streptomyces sp. SHP 1-2 TaxID=2769489 RepID=UPI00223763E2|nr:hypothetical protein [Streptomyces sp. SHP 1-2]MCW5251253.1 hypothetical protein [Streptomyces sp. SHP 1-2]